MRLDIRRIGSIKDRDEVVGNQTRVKVVKKNKVAPPFKQVEFDIMLWRRHLENRRIAGSGCQSGVVEKSGALYSYGDERNRAGTRECQGFLRENPQRALEIEDKIRAAARSGFPHGRG